MSKKKVLLGILLSFICIICTVINLGLQASAAAAQVIDCDIQEEYARGSEFVMPEGKVSYKGQDKTPDVRYVVFPSGKAKTGETVVLSEAGQYELVFKADFDGVTVSAKKSFVVNKTLLQVNNDSSSAQLVDGKIVVSLAPDDVFTYNEVLDLSAASKEVPLLNLEVDPNTVGTADASRIKIRFTDLYDEENYVTISLNSMDGDWAKGHIYVTAGAAHQPQVGVENAANPEGKKAYVNDTYGYGAAVNFSMHGMPKSETDTVLALYFDYDQKILYADREAYSGTNQMLVDLDSLELFGDDQWNGFTTGQVKMTVFATNYQAPNCNFTISTINGNSEFHDSGDKSAPVVTVDTGYEADQIPTALVGVPYPLFDAQAVDGYDGKLPVITSVYRKYYSENPVKVAVQDGKFVPESEGVYIIEYSAVDQSGNVGASCVSVQAVQGEGLQVELQDAAAQTDTGAAVQVISGISCANASGNVTYSVTAKNAATGDEAVIDTQTYLFTPMSAGDWEITVTAQDYISAVQKTFTVTANPTTQPQVYDTVGVPDHFILGAAYELPTLYGYDFSSGAGVLTAMEIYVTESESEERKLEAGRYIPEKAGSAAVTYRLTVDGKVCEKTYDVTVVDVGYTGDLDLSKYFVVSKGAATAQPDTGYITYEINEDTKLDFVNFVQVKQLAFSFQIGEKNAYNKVHIYLTDIVNGKQLKLTYSRTADGAVFCVNDGTETKLSSAFEGMNTNFSIEFNNDQRIVTPETNIDLKVKSFLDGSEFTGFTNNVARFTVDIEGVSGASQILIKNLNGHTINNATEDRFEPQILVDTKSGDRGKGEKVTLTAAFAYDVLDPISTLKLEVTDPSGAYVSDENGVLLDGTQDATQGYTFTVEEFGDYVIRYTIADGSGKTDYYVYAITTKDIEGPTITLQKHKETAKIGETVALAGTQVTDNFTEECTVAVYVFGPENTCVEVTDGKFAASAAGVYSVRYMAFDEEGNYAFASYEIDVK